MAQDPDSTPGEAIGELVDELLRAAATLSRTAASPGHLATILTHELTGHTVTELLDAAGLVGCATDAIARDLAPSEAPRSAG